MYKDALGTSGVFLKERENIRRSGCRLGIYYKTSAGYNRMGNLFFTNAKIIPVNEIINNSYEDTIRKLSKE